MGIIKYLEQTLKKLNLASLFYTFYFAFLENLHMGIKLFLQTNCTYNQLIGEARIQQCLQLGNCNYNSLTKNNDHF